MPPNVTTIPSVVPAIFTSVAPPVDPTFGESDVTERAETTVGATVDAGIDEEPQPATT
jgi:hypothetical protein